MLNFIFLSLILFATFLGALATFLIKKGLDSYSLRKLFFSSNLWAGLVLYGISVILYILILRVEELSVIYPLMSTTYIWTTVFSVKYLGEKMNKWKWTSLLGIILGIIFIGLGS